MVEAQSIDPCVHYYFHSVESLKAEIDSATFANWWKDGGLGPAEMKRIVMTKIPQARRNQVKLHDSSHGLRDEKATDVLVDFLTTLENVEQATRTAQQAGLMTQDKQIHDSTGRQSQRDHTQQHYYGHGPSARAPM